MMDAHEGKAILEDVDLDTFLRFVQWLYHGYYDAAEPFRVSNRGVPQDDAQTVQLAQLREGPDSYVNIEDLGNDTNLGLWDRSETDIDSWGRSSVSKKKIKGTELVHNSPLKKGFIKRQYKMRNASKDNPQPRKNTHHEEDYSEVFLGHARLYVFADKYDIENLKVLAMEELHATLAGFTMYQQRTRDIVALLRYIYANTAETKSGVEDLRSLMTGYIGAEIETLIKDKDLEALMSEDASMLADIMGVVRSKIAAYDG